MATNNFPLISIIITTKNEEKNIGNCLESIKAQKYPQEKIEVIVVDNNSSDRTKEIAKKYTKNVYNFGPERSAQRNFGIKKAKGEYVMYLDADMILSSTIIEEVIKKFQNSSIQYSISNIPLVALYIPEIVLGNSFWSKVRRFERSFYDGTVIDCVRVVRKDIFEKVGGFDLSMTGPEDWDFDKKVRQQGKVEVLTKYDFEELNRKILDIRNWRLDKNGLKKLIVLTSEPVIYHNEAEFNLKRYLAKKSYYAQSFKKYIEKWSRKDSFASHGIKAKSDPDIKKQFGFWYRYFGVFLENGKWKRLLRHPILTLGMYFLRGLVGGSYLKSLLTRYLKVDKNIY